jgi:E3 ubiquitin-protein ligase MARCH6
VPWALATFITATALKDRPETHILAFRYSYPLFLCFGVVLFAIYLLWGMLRRWQMLIRDEVYLIGERLHNFGERKSTSVSTGGPPNMRRIET